jgi:hypothetical protein
MAVNYHWYVSSSYDNNFRGWPFYDQAEFSITFVVPQGYRFWATITANARWYRSFWIWNSLECDWKYLSPMVVYGP